MDSTLARDLRVASTTSFTLPPTGRDSVNLALETAPRSAPEPKVAPRRAPTGDRRVRSEHPTVAAAPVNAQAAGRDLESVLDIITQPTATPVAEAAVAAEAPRMGEVADGAEAVPLPRPTPVSIEDVGIASAGGGWGGGGVGPASGPGSGPVWGGVVIRGGDIDDCRIEPRTRNRRPVYSRGPVGGIGRTSPWPASDRGQVNTGGSERSRAGQWPVSSGSRVAGRDDGARPGTSRWPVRQ